MKGTRYTREQRIENALRQLVIAVTERNRLSEDDANMPPEKARRHQAIDFTGSQLRKIGVALCAAREALEQN